MQAWFFSIIPVKSSANDVADPRIEDAEDGILRVTATAIAALIAHLQWILPPTTRHGARGTSSWG